MQVRDAVAKILSTGSVSVNLGGDHTISIGTVIAHAEAVSSGVALIWIDAHGDINTARTNPTGEFRNKFIWKCRWHNRLRTTSCV